MKMRLKQNYKPTSNWKKNTKIYMLSSQFKYEHNPFHCLKASRAKAHSLDAIGIKGREKLLKLFTLSKGLPTSSSWVH